MRFQLAGNDRLDEAVLEISTSYFQLFVPGSSLRGICESWIIAHLLALEHQHLVLPNRARLFDIPSFLFPVQTKGNGGDNDEVLTKIMRSYSMVIYHINVCFRV